MLDGVSYKTISNVRLLASKEPRITVAARSSGPAPLRNRAPNSSGLAKTNDGPPDP